VSPLDESGLLPQNPIYNSILCASVLSTLSLVAVLVSNYFIRGGKPFHGKSWANSEVATPASTWINEISWRVSWLWFPFFASIELGGTPVALAAIIATSDFFHQFAGSISSMDDIRTICARNKVKIVAALGIALRALFTVVQDSSAYLGYIAFIGTIFMLGGPSIRHGSKSQVWPSFVSSMQDIKYTAASAGLSAAVSMILFLTVSDSSPVRTSTLFWGILVMISIGSGVIFLQSQHFRSNESHAIAISTTVVVIFWFWTNSQFWDFSYAALSALVYYSLAQDRSNDEKDAPYRHQNGHSHDSHHSHHQTHSKFTGVLLSCTTPGSIIHSILSEKDSRRIAYFAWYAYILNFVLFYN
jgi:solute carrier family 30 (zinc transporter), member 5/7